MLKRRNYAILIGMNETNTLQSHLLKNYPGTSNSTFRKWLKYKRVIVNNDPAVSLNMPLSSSDKVKLLPKKTEDSLLNVLHQDPDFIVINKPAGLLSVALDKGGEINLHSLLKKTFPKEMFFPVHRLDRETSGVILFAKNRRTWLHFKQALEKREISRKYYALVEGSLTEKKGIWKHKLQENSHLKMVSHPEGKVAITHFRKLTQRKQETLLEIHLETGRKNQIRAQAEIMGYPIVGDKKYGSSSLNSRLMLHAFCLEFKHPVSRKPLSFQAPLPIELKHFCPY